MKQLITTQRLAKLRQQAAVLGEDADMNGSNPLRYPPKVPPFKAPPEAEWLTPRPCTAVTETRISVRIPRSSTRIEILEVMHHAYIKLK